MPVTCYGHGMSEVTYSTRQIADSLQLGSAMVRKYAIALETITGQEIPMKRRDGRQFSPEHFQVISKAKALVDSNNGLSVDTALKMVLSGPENAANAIAAPGAAVDTPELAAALTAAIAKGNEPLLAELQQLRQDLLQARQDNPAQDKQIAQPAPNVTDDQTQPNGLLVRAALRLQSWLRR